MLGVGIRLNKACYVDKDNVLPFSNRPRPEQECIRKGYAHGRSCPSQQNRVPELRGEEPGMACQCGVMVILPYDSQRLHRTFDHLSPSH